MKKSFILSSLIIVPLLASCNKGSIDMPKSPFDDPYTRIGMVGEYNKTDDMTKEDYNAIRNYISEQDNKDENVASYHRQEEVRDLKYAYFGEESSTISQCSMTSRSEDLKRYKNRVSTNTDIIDQQIQTANGGIQKSKLTSEDYTFDTEYINITEPDPSGTYIERIKSKKNDEEEIVEEPTPSTPYSGENEIYTVFGLKPFNSRIKSHFTEDGDYKFKLLGPDNKAVYFKSDDKYLIKEGYSLYPDFHTTMGRSYKAQDNYFYEGLLEKVGEKFRFTHFRFYHELLILSKSIDGTGVPIVYLEKPVLIEFSETTYSNIEYKEETNLDLYTGSVPPSPKE